MEMQKPCFVGSCHNEPEYKCYCNLSTYFCEEHWHTHSLAHKGHEIMRLSVELSKNTVDSVKSFLIEKLEDLSSKERLILEKNASKISQSDGKTTMVLEKIESIGDSLRCFVNDISNLKKIHKYTNNEFYKALLESDEKAKNWIAHNYDLSSYESIISTLGEEIDIEAAICSNINQHFEKIINPILRKLENNIQKVETRTEKLEKSFKEIINNKAGEIKIIQEKNSKLEQDIKTLTEKIIKIENIKNIGYGNLRKKTQTLKYNFWNRIIGYLCEFSITAISCLLLLLIIFSFVYPSKTNNLGDSKSLDDGYFWKEIINLDIAYTNAFKYISEYLIKILQWCWNIWEYLSKNDSRVAREI